MSIHTVGKGVTGFFNTESITFSTLHRLRISMGGDGVSDISAGAGEGVGRMVNGAGLTLGSIARSGAFLIILLQHAIEILIPQVMWSAQVVH